jgi:hypothetical protein
MLNIPGMERVGFRHDYNNDIWKFFHAFMNSWINRTRPENRDQYAALYDGWSAAQTLGPLGGSNWQGILALSDSGSVPGPLYHSFTIRRLKKMDAAGENK